MVVLGIDAHKRTHTAVAVDEHGRKVGVKTVPATSAGNLELVRWAGEFGKHRFAVEDCRHLSRRLERDLLAAGEALVRVPPKLMAQTRRSAREQGKSDPIDAMSIARAAQREDDLPTAHLDGPEREARLRVDHREDLVNERTRAQNRLHWHLHELDPTLQLVAGSMDRYVVLDRLAALCASQEGTVAEI
ncbi:MAG: IS110 family transposase, partial [Acidimicrobiales bacterium]